MGSMEENELLRYVHNIVNMLSLDISNGGMKDKGGNIMKSAKDLKKIYDEWKHIDNLYNGEKSNWNDILSSLRYIEFKLEKLVIRKDDNRVFIDYVRLKMIEDIKKEENRVLKKIPK